MSEEATSLNAVQLASSHLGGPVALTAVAFAVGLLVLPFSTETKAMRLPD